MVDQLLLNGLDILRDSPASQQMQTSDWPDVSDGQVDCPAEEEDNPIQSILKLLAEFLDSEVCVTDWSDRFSNSVAELHFL